MAEEIKRKVSTYIFAAVIAVALLAAVFNSFTIIDPNEVGVVKTMGKISRTLERGSGLNGKLPFVQTVTKLDMSPKQTEIVFSVGTDGAISKDMQTIGVNCTLIYTFNESGIITYVTDYTENSLNEMFKSNTRTAIKEIIGKYSVYDLTSSTEVISGQIKERLASMCGNMPITISQVNVANWDWSEDFDRQIKETMQTTQKVKQAEQEALVAEQIAQKQVKEAEAKKKADVIAATAKLEVAEKEAEAIKIAAEAEAYKNSLIVQNLAVMRAQWEHEEEMKRLEKWNGQYVPTNNYGPIPVQSGSVLGQR